MQVVGNVTVDPKSSVPTVKKEVQDQKDDKDVESTDANGWGNTADHAIGESFNFRLTATIPANANLKAYDSYKVVFNDTMSKGIAFEKINSVKVKYGETTLTLADSAYTKTDPTAVTGTDGSKSWSLTIADLKNVVDKDNSETKFDAAALGTQAITVEVEYAAHLNADAEVTHESGASTANKNGVSLDYSNNPNVGGEGETGKTPTDRVIVFTYQLDINKTFNGGTPAENDLPKFKLYKFDSTTKDYTINRGEVTITKTEDGKYTASFKRVDDGKYKLVETKTPAGFNTAADTLFEITADHDVTSIDPKLTSLKINSTDGNITAGTVVAAVVNQKGSNLPSTGGMGTTVLYAAGAAIVLAAAFGIAFAVRRRNAR